MKERFYVTRPADGAPRGLLVTRADYLQAIWNSSDKVWNRTGFIPGVTGDDWDSVSESEAIRIARELDIPWTWQQVPDDAPFLTL